MRFAFSYFIFIFNDLNYGTGIATTDAKNAFLEVDENGKEAVAVRYVP
jgi:hypothetical protein